MAERANRTLIEMSRCLLLQANLPKSLWAETVNTAAFIRNRCPSKSLNEQTPFELWYQEKPFVGFMKIIGSKAIVLEKGKRQGKFEPKGKEYTLVAYSNESKAYRLWQPGTKRIIKSRDVRFIENVNNQMEKQIELLHAPFDFDKDEFLDDDSKGKQVRMKIQTTMKHQVTKNESVMIKKRHIIE